MEGIFKIVLNETGQNKANLMGSSRIGATVHARRIFCLFAIKAGYSFSNVGKTLKRGHTTIMYLYQTYVNTQEAVKLIEKYSDKAEQISKERFAGIEVTRGKYAHIFRKYKGKCAVCDFDDVLSIHHIKPRYLGGGDNEENLIALCPNHHALADRGMLVINNKSDSYTQ